MTDWSKVGRRSRRKGKRFEQSVARYLSRVSGHVFTSTRNSGRTDLKGDVYSTSCTLPVVIECKDRGLSVKSLMLGVRWLEAAIGKVKKEAGADAYVVFVKADGVAFIHGDVWALERLYGGGTKPDCEVKDVHGRIWRRVVIGGESGTGG